MAEGKKTEQAPSEKRSEPAGLGPLMAGGPNSAAQALRKELSERVEEFRRRRSRLRAEADAGSTLELDFESAERTVPDFDAQVEQTRQDEAEPDLVTQSEPGGEFDATLHDAPPPEESGESSPLLAWAATEASEPEAGPSLGESREVEILLEPASAGGQNDELKLGTGGVTLAPMGRRFVAGLLDALMLLISAGLFALIFWRAGGHMSLAPVNLVVIAVIGVIFIMAYFGLFTALTSTTPGMVWMGIEVRSLEGRFPTAREAFWRAFGYLVSMASLMLGFIWALVDSEGFTWHDRMSGTYLAASDTEYRRLG